MEKSCNFNVAVSSSLMIGATENFGGLYAVEGLLDTRAVGLSRKQLSLPLNWKVSEAGDYQEGGV